MSRIVQKLRTFEVTVTDSKGNALGQVRVRATSRKVASDTAIEFLRKQGVKLPTTVFTPQITEQHVPIGSSA